MVYTLGQAAKAVGKGKTTVLKAIKSGRISAKKDDNGQWAIDPSELHRVYPPVNENSSPTAEKERQTTPSELIELRVQVQALHEQNSLLKDERDDLRRRLDVENEERRKLTMMLTDQRNKPPQKAIETPLTIWQWLGLQKR